MKIRSLEREREREGDVRGKKQITLTDIKLFLLAHQTTGDE